MTTTNEEQRRALATEAEDFYLRGIVEGATTELLRLAKLLGDRVGDEISEAEEAEDRITYGMFKGRAEMLMELAQEFTAEARKRLEEAGA